MDDIRFGKPWKHVIGGIEVTLARPARSESGTPVVYAAALSKDELDQGFCGWGATEAEAVADLFRCG